MLASRGCLRILTALVFTPTAFFAHPVSAEIGDLIADGVIGQSRFTDSVALPIGPNGFGAPRGVAIDRSVRPNRVYVADSVYHRVLGWADVDALANGAPADIVIGQPDAFSWGCNAHTVFDGVPSAPTLSSLCSPAGLAVDGSGNLYVADSNNCRVLVFRDPFNTDGVADAVLGQSAPGYQGCGVAADKLYEPMGVAVDAAGNAFVADTLNCRVLEFDSPLTTDTIADRVFGQANFTDRTCSVSNLYFPSGVSVDTSERLYVSSPQYVLSEFDDALTSDAVVDRVLGTGQCNAGGESSATTCGILAAAADDAGRLYVADSGNSRVLEFDTPLTVPQASRVFGQSGFTGTSDLFHDGCNTGGASATSLCLRKVRLLTLGGTYDEAGALTLDDDGRLWVADGLNNRVLRYDSPLKNRAADLALGQESLTDVRQPVFALEQPQAALYQSYVLVLEPAASRLLVYLNYDYARATPIAVIGQPDFETTGCDAVGLNGGALCNPRGLSVDASGDLWIADTGNDRVLRFARPWLRYDVAAKRYVPKTTADAVFGQPDASSNGCAAGATGLCAPFGVASDPTHSLLYIADTGNSRIVRHENPLADAIADGVIGQADFAQTACDGGGLGPAALCGPQGLTLDQDGALYAADSGNNRVLLYERGATSATLVLGQPGMDMSGPSAGVGGMNAPLGVSVDRRGNVYVADHDNNRVLEYDAPRTNDTAADRVFGQPDFDSVVCGTSDRGLCGPVGVSEQTFYDDTLAIADAGNNRVLIFDSPFCVDDYQLTAANRKSKTVRSKPKKAKLKISAGAGAADHTLTFVGLNILLERDAGIYPNESPLLTLSTASGVVYQERAPSLTNIRLSAHSETWGTEYLKGERDVGIDDFQVKESFVSPAIAPSYAKYKYKGRAVGLDLGDFTATAAKWRIQWGGTCFTTDLACRNGSCTPAK